MEYPCLIGRRQDEVNNKLAAVHRHEVERQSWRSVSTIEE